MMMHLISSLKLFYAIYIYLKDPNQVDAVLRIGNTLLPKNSENLNKNIYLNNTVFLEMIKSRYGIVKKGVENENTKTESIKHHSLGKSYDDFIKKNNLNPDFYQGMTTKEISTDHEYIVFRIRQTHDFWHVVTGFTTSQEDEAGLIAFYYAQLRTPLSALIVGLSFLHFLRKRPQDLPHLFNKITRGWQLGMAAKPLISYKWEENLDKSLFEVRSELGILQQAEP